MTPDGGTLAEIARLRGVIAALDPDGLPAAALTAGDLPAAARRIGVLPGSFNPPTEAHAALIEVPLTAGLIDAGLHLLSVRTVDKERVTGLWLEDRLIALDRLIAGRPGRAAVLANRGLYVDQVAALRAALVPDSAEIVFLVGFDKILQIFDPRYYEDRDEALRRLFAGASILVAPRAGQDDRDLAALLDRPENRPFADRVAPLPLPAGLVDPDLSATLVREALAAGRPPTGLADPVARFLAAIGAFAPPIDAGGDRVDRYELRHWLADHLIAKPGSLDAEVAFAEWQRAATEPFERGRELRRWLGTGT